MNELFIRNLLITLFLSFLPFHLSSPAANTRTNLLNRQCNIPSKHLTNRLNRLNRRMSKFVLYEDIHPTNYDTRSTKDVFGNPLEPLPSLIVLHETVYGVGSALATFKTKHTDLLKQASYHVLIAEDGRIIKILDPLKRAFGAGNSSFRGNSVQTNLRLPPSVNNFALHISLETPLDGEDNDPTHSGYSSKQYDSLSLILTDWMKKYHIPYYQITTHKIVDRSGERIDPRSFNWRALQDRLGALGMLCP